MKIGHGRKAHRLYGMPLHNLQRKLRRGLAVFGYGLFLFDTHHGEASGCHLMVDSKDTTYIIGKCHAALILRKEYGSGHLPQGWNISTFLRVMTFQKKKKNRAATLGLELRCAFDFAASSKATTVTG